MTSSSVKTKNPFFDLEDLSKFEFFVTVFNTTSQMKITGREDRPDVVVRILEINKEGLQVSLPPRCCARGHTLALDISVKKPTPEPDGFTEASVHVLGVVELLEGEPTEQQTIHIRLRQYAQTEWEHLLSFLTNTQTGLNNLIKKTRK